MFKRLILLFTMILVAEVGLVANVNAHDHSENEPKIQRQRSKGKIKNFFNRLLERLKKKERRAKVEPIKDQPIQKNKPVQIETIEKQKVPPTEVLTTETPDKKPAAESKLYKPKDLYCQFDNKEVIDKITIHETASGRNRADPIAHVKKVHKDGKYRESAYHYIIHGPRSGENFQTRIETGRNINIVGAHNNAFAHVDYANRRRNSPNNSFHRTIDFDNAQDFITCYNKENKNKITIEEYLSSHQQGRMSENFRSIGIAFVTNPDESNHENIPKFRDEVIIQTAKKICDLWQTEIPKLKYLDGHKDTDKTNCPGHVESQLGDIVIAVEAECGLKLNSNHHDWN